VQSNPENYVSLGYDQAEMKHAGVTELNTTVGLLKR